MTTVKKINKHKKIKTYAQKITQKKRRELVVEVNTAINKHESFRNAYFFTPPDIASMRRRYEKCHSIYVSFKYDGNFYEYESFVDCSCRNVYYDHYFSVNGKSVTVRTFKKVRDELYAAIEVYDAKHNVQ